MFAAWGNIDHEAFRAITTGVRRLAPPAVSDFPTINDGVVGIFFVETAVKNFAVGTKRLKIPER